MAIAIGAAAALGGTALATQASFTNDWAFDEADGSTAIDSGGSDDGIIGASVTRIPGHIGAGALHFPAGSTLDSAVDFGTSVGQFGTNDFTLAVWVRTTALFNQEIVGNRLAPSNGNFFALRTKNGFIELEIDQDGAGTHHVDLQSAAIYADGNWHIAIARRAGADVTLFVDGTNYGTHTTPGGATNVNNGNHFIAGFSPGVQPCCHTAFLGDLDDIHVLDRAITDAEATTDANSNGNPDIFEPDTTPPAVRVPGTLIVTATGPNGAVVSYSVSATDPDDAPDTLTIQCAPASGSVFPIGDTTVTCTASDPAGNQSSPASFRVHVVGAAELLQQLIGSSARVGPGVSLGSKALQAGVAVNRHDTATACAIMQAYLNEVAALRGKRLTNAAADLFTAAAQRIRAVLGC